ncbi:MAG: hypothetical protein Q9178_000797 [Gyalolechia marmorata]
MADYPCCTLCWEPPNFDQADDQWVYCNRSEAEPSPTPSNGTFDHCQINPDPWSEYPSPCRNPESPLDQSDLDRFQRRTIDLAAGTRYSPDMDVDFFTMVPGSEPMSDPPSLRTLCQGLGDRLAHLESSKEELCRSLELDIDEIRNLLTELTEAVNSVDVPSQCNSPVSNEVSFDSDEQSELDSSCATSQRMAPEALQYVQNWHNGGLVIVENLSEHARMRDIHEFFHSCGTITYLELHGADKSRPHINSRHAYIHFAEYNQAVRAHLNHHGSLFQDKTLMVFLLSTAVVRGEPGKPYLGSALEILNFAGGQNYASSEADYLRANEDLQELNEHSNTKAPLQQSVIGSNTFSLKPNLTAKTAASWRRENTLDVDTKAAPEDDTTSKEPDVETSRQACNAVVAEIKPLPVGQPGAYVPPTMRKRKASSVTDIGDTNPRRSHPVKRVLKPGEPLPNSMFYSGMVVREDSSAGRLAAEDFVLKGKEQPSLSPQAAIDDDVDDEEEGGVLL